MNPRPPPISLRSRLIRINDCDHAHLQLADAVLLYGDEDRAEELYEGQTKEALAKRAAALEASAHPRAAAAAAWLKKR